MSDTKKVIKRHDGEFEISENTSGKHPYSLREPLRKTEKYQVDKDGNMYTRDKSSGQWRDKHDTLDVYEMQVLKTKAENKG